jgi:exonuclease III
MKYRLFTYNVDFAKKNSLETRSLGTIKDEADILCVQEAKHLNVVRSLGNNFSGHQNRINQAKQGVALAWRRSKVQRKTNKPGERTNVRHKGYVLGVSNLGRRMLPRYLNYRDLVVGGITVRVISTHRPPQRFRVLWSLFDRALIAFIKRSPYPVIIGMDSNEHTHRLFARKSGMVWYGVGIDGFWLSKSLVKHVVRGSLKAHPKAWSDHHPVSIDLDI